MLSTLGARGFGGLIAGGRGSSEGKRRDGKRDRVSAPIRTRFIERLLMICESAKRR